MGAKIKNWTSYLRLFTIIYDYLFRLFLIFRCRRFCWFSIIPLVVVPSLQKQICVSACVPISPPAQKKCWNSVWEFKNLTFTRIIHTTGDQSTGVLREHQSFIPCKAPHKIWAKISFVMKYAYLLVLIISEKNNWE